MHIYVDIYMQLTVYPGSLLRLPTDPLLIIHIFQAAVPCWEKSPVDLISVEQSLQ